MDGGGGSDHACLSIDCAVKLVDDEKIWVHFFEYVERNTAVLLLSNF